VDPEAFGQIEKGLVSLLRHLRMLPGTASPAERAIVIGSRSNVSSDFDGIFYRQVRAGQHVEAGAALGYITDFSGAEFQGLWVGPHLFTRLADVDRFANVMVEIARTGVLA